MLGLLLYVLTIRSVLFVVCKKLLITVFSAANFYNNVLYCVAMMLTAYVAS